jgi:PfaB family protein
VAAATLACYERLLPNDKTNTLIPWASSTQRTASITVNALGDQSMSIYLREEENFSRVSSFAKSKPQIYIYSGKNREEVLHSLSVNKMSDAGSARLTIVADSEQEWQQRRDIALDWLTKNPTTELLPEGIYYQDKPISGEMAFVFTGATTTYMGMGHELLINFPELLTDLASEVNALQPIVDLLYARKEKNSLSMFDELKTYCFLSQIHARFSQNILRLKPDACIGYCSGESNALVAMKAWRDMEQLFADIETSKIYTDTLSGQFSILDQNYQTKNATKWTTWRVFADVNKVKEIIAKESFVRLTIINTPYDCIIAGRPEDCDKVLKQLNNPQAKVLPYHMVIHCPEFLPEAETWYKLHYRKTYDVPGIRFYSSSTGQHYLASSENAASALLSQASAMVDFSAVIQRAWQDGVRIFLEHGPRDLCSRWIADILKDKDYLAVSLDVLGVNPVRQAVNATAKLLAAGCAAPAKKRELLLI